MREMLVFSKWVEIQKTRSRIWERVCIDNNQGVVTAVTCRRHL